MIRELPSFLAGCGALLLFGIVLTGARNPQEADHLQPGRMEASAITVPDSPAAEGTQLEEKSGPSSSLAWNR